MGGLASSRLVDLARVRVLSFTEETMIDKAWERSRNKIRYNTWRRWRRNEDAKKVALVKAQQEKEYQERMHRYDDLFKGVNCG